MAMAMAVDDDDRKSRLKATIENLRASQIILRKENVDMLPLLCPRLVENKARFPFLYPTLGLGTRGELIDLDGVKCYCHSDIAPFTHDLLQKHLIGKTFMGRLLRGKIEPSKKDIIIKTWDVSVFRPGGPEMFHPLRVYDEIMFMRKDFVKSHPNVPRLIGYSIDTTLAIIYELPSMDIQSVNTLRGMLDSGNYNMDSRLDVAIRVAHMMKDFHEMGIAIAGIDTYNILVDKENNMKLCEFGLREHMDEAKGFMPHIITSAAYIFPESCTALVPIDNRPTAASDVYGYGCLLVELFSEAAYGSCDVTNYVKRQRFLIDWAMEQLNSGATSIVAKCLGNDEDVGSEITKLVAKCLEFEPDQRCDTSFILEKLEIVREMLNPKPVSRPSKKPKIST